MSYAAEELLASPELIQRLASGDRSAVALLAHECSGLLLDYLKKTKGRHGLCEADWMDVLQEVYVKFIHEPPELDPFRPVLPYLRRMILNEARDMVRKTARRTNYEGSAGKQRILLAAGAEAVGKTTEHAEDKTLVESKLAKMSENDRNALKAYVAAGPDKHVVELARREGIELGAAQMRYARAVKRWEKEMESDEAESEGQA